MPTAELDTDPGLEDLTESAGVHEHLRAPATSGNSGVDVDNEIIRGVIIAEEGVFKTPGRGEFDAAAVRSLTGLSRQHADGLKVRFGHHDGGNEGLGFLLGRITNVTHGTNAAGKAVSRGDLKIDPSAHVTPSGDLGRYVLAVAQSDPKAVAMSLVLDAELAFRLDNRGRRKLAEDGSPLPPLWRPKMLGGVDLVDTGEATSGLLSTIAKGGYLSLALEGAAGTRAEIEQQASAWLTSYLDNRFGPATDAAQPAQGDGAQGGTSDAGATADADGGTPASGSGALARLELELAILEAEAT